MGSFFTNIQVHVGTGPIEKPEQQVIQLLRNRMSNASLVEAGPGEDADREIAAAFSPGSTWVTVYDEWSEDQDPKKLESLASFLSGKINEPVVSVSVHDSSVLHLELFHHGTRIDLYSSRPDYFKKVSPQVQQTLSGQTIHWKPVLAPGKNETDLRRAFDDKSLFAEDTLTKIASVLGWDPLACTLGFNDMEEAELPGLISGKCTMGRAWCTRFLRGVTRHLWLGPQLADRLGNTTILDSSAHTESFGESLKIVLPGDQSMDHLEKALAVLLPGETD